MLETFFSAIANFILKVISRSGYLGVFFLMVLESCNIPVPSEITMPFAGFLVNQKIFSLLILALIGALGNLFGSLISYFIALKLKNDLKNFLAKSKIFYPDYLSAEKFFIKYGDKSVFLARLLPIVRTFISFPAGIFGVKLNKFIIYTFIGSFGWSYFLAQVGYYLGERWTILSVYFRDFDYLIVAVFITGIIYYIIKKVREIKTYQRSN